MKRLFPATISQMLSTSALSLTMTMTAVACSSATPEADTEQGSSLASVSLSLPAKDKLPEGVASLLTHYSFYAIPSQGPYSIQGCATIEKQGEYTVAATLEGKLNSACNYQVVLVLGKPQADGVLQWMGASPAGDAKNPQLESYVQYQGMESVTTEDMRGKSKIDLTIALERFDFGQEDPYLPDDIQIGEDLDLEVGVTFPEEGGGSSDAVPTIY